MDSTLLEAALSYSRLGLPVLPLHHLELDEGCSCRSITCHPKHHGKHPRIKEWQWLASHDLAQIQKWWKRWPRANIGIATGTGIIVLDVDGPAGEQTLNELESRHGPLPATAEVRTGSGGRHLYFRTTEPVGNAVKFLPGLDVRGENGQVVAPPSMHYSGNRYTWLRSPDQGIAQVPAWLLAVILEHQNRAQRKPAKKAKRKPASSSTARAGSAPPSKHQRRLPSGNTEDCDRLLKEMIVRFPITGPGQRNDRMVRAVGSLLGRGCSADLTRLVLTAWLEEHQELMTTDLETACRQLDYCIDSTLSSETFQVGGQGPAVLEICRDLQLTPLQKAFLESAILLSTSPSSPVWNSNCQTSTERPSRWSQVPEKTSLPVSTSRDLDEQENIGSSKRFGTVITVCSGKQERAFVEAWLVHCLYKRLNTDEQPVIKATDKQIQAIIHARSGIEMDDKTFYRLKAKFISRPGKPATKVELLTELTKGRRLPGQRAGVPSEYALGWLGSLFEQEQKRPPPDEEPEEIEEPEFYLLGPDESEDLDFSAEQDALQDLDCLGEQDGDLELGDRFAAGEDPANAIPEW